MTVNNSHRKLFQSAAFTFLYFSLFSASFTAAANVSQAPLSLSEGVPPNMIFTLDDSTSMAWAYIPDSPDGGLGTRRIKSSYSNPMYYDPSVTYVIPPSFNSSGVEQQLSTSFTSAYTNGFAQGVDTRDLSSKYRPTSGHNIPGGNHNYSENPETDFRATINISSNNTTKTSTTPAGIEFSIRRHGSNTSYSCEITAPAALTDITPNCSRSGSNYTASLTGSQVPAYYYVFDDSLAGCTGSTDDKRNNDNCYSLKWVTSSSGIGGADERQNFAIWYSFYRTRALATLSAASLAFYDLSPAVRLTWQSLIHCKTLDSTSCNDNKFRPYSSSQRGNFYSWLQNGTNFKVAGGTPLRAAMTRAGDFLTGSRAWENIPHGTGNTPENTYACRPSYHIMMTDGMWNSNNGSENSSLSQPARHDNTTFTLPDAKGEYDKQRPYYSTHGWGSNKNYTLADLAMNYWATDLRPGLGNKIQPYMPFKSGNDENDYWDPRNNPATWQHMVNYTMGLGLSHALNESGIPWEGNTFSGAGYDALKAGTESWPLTVPTGNGAEANVYDLWHAAINSRGEFFSVDSPDAMVQAFADILDRIADRKSTASRPAVNSSMEDDGTGTNFVRYLYQTSYASDENWAGDLKRIKREQPAGAAPTETQMWSAQHLLNLKTPDSRNIKIAASSGTTGLQNFTWTQISSDVNTQGTLAHYLRTNPETGSLENASAAQGRLNFIRGVRTGEGTTYRQRMHVLGDMYSSTPAIVSGPRYLESFANRLEGNTAYTTFINTITDRTNPNPDARQPRSPRVYVGANDGMLHAFNANTGDETFAFIPTAVFPKLNKLTGSNYSHEFYVDGSPVVADVYFGSEWRTILVGTLRAGGKSIFALDVTTPGSEKLLWEFDESDITDANAVKPGYSFSRPTIARLHNGEWAVVIGNGYEDANTADGKAALYIIDAQTGWLTKSLEVQGAAGIPNGLSTPRLADYNSDGIADYAYAGDLQGNLWRFDLLGSGADPARASGSIYGNDNSNTDNFRVSYGGQPMFTATSTAGSARQPITAPPSLIRHPTRTGYLVVFGTGKYFETTDKDGVKTHAQSVYGIWDRSTKAETTSAGTISRSNLVSQEITDTVVATADSGATRTARTISNNPISWYTADGAVDKWGWRLDLAIGASYQGEMVIEDMSALGQTIFFQSLVPNDDPCASGSSNWTYAINPFTGGKTNHHPFDYKGTGDTIVSAIQQAGEGGFTVSQTPDGQYELSTGSESVRIYADPTSIGRQSWRIVGSQ